MSANSAYIVDYSRDHSPYHNNAHRVNQLGISPKAVLIRQSNKDMSSSSGCLGRVPFGSLFALFLCWVGSGLFCSMMYQGVNASIKQATSLLNVQLPWLNKVQIAFISIATIMAFVALILFVLGVLATGETRRSVYQGFKARLGGRVTSAIFLLLTYFLNLCWLAVYCSCAVLAAIYWFFTGMCKNTAQGDHIDLSSFCRVLNGTVIQSPSACLLKDERMRLFCTISENAENWYGVAFIGATLVVLSLIHFMICLAANYAHIKDELKYMELEDIRLEETNAFEGRF